MEGTGRGDHLVGNPTEAAATRGVPANQNPQLPKDPGKDIAPTESSSTSPQPPGRVPQLAWRSLHCLAHQVSWASLKTKTSSSQRTQHPEESTEFNNWISLTPTYLASRQRSRGQRSAVRQQSQPVKKMFNINKFPCPMKHSPEQRLSSNPRKGRSHCAVIQPTACQAPPWCTKPRGRASSRRQRYSQTWRIQHTTCQVFSLRWVTQRVRISNKEQG